MREPRNRPKLICGKGRTLQSEAEACDINVIVAQYRTTGTLTHLSNAMPKYEDFSKVIDFTSAMEQVRRAESLFEALPSEIRSKFENDPAKLLTYLDDPSNNAEAIKMGLINPSEAIIVPNDTTAPEKLSITDDGEKTQSSQDD